MSPETKLALLKERMAEVIDLYQAASLLGWDQQTLMPPAGAEARGNQMATLEKIAHLKFTSPEVGKLLDDLLPYADQLDPDADDARYIKVTQRRYIKDVCVPPEMVTELAQATATAQPAWVNARKNNDFASFQPHLEHIFDLRRRYAELFAPYEHIYDPLLDDFEPGLKTADVKAIFNTLRPQQVALIQAITGRPQVDNSFVFLNYEDQKQWDFGKAVLTEMGYDWNRSRIDKSPHPFTTSFGRDDVRITTRVNENNIGTALFGTLHEAGHAMYDMGHNPAYERGMMGTAASLAVHESQSRMIENLVGRSYSFWQHFYPRLQETFPAQLGSVSLEAFYKGINRVNPSLIRVEADEATYNLHIMLRLELELAVLEGSLAVKDLPEAWNSRVHEYLGLTPPDDALGVLQDIHWSWGMVGYFSTYALGNLVSAQLWERINADIPDLAEQVCNGQFGSLRGWLGEKVHWHGGKYEPQELIQRITGSKIDPAPYMRYLTSKYSAIYGL